jgi:hypothetical protein
MIRYVMVALLLAGCGAGQQVLSAQATVVRDTQPERFSAYEEAHSECLASSPDLTAYLLCTAASRHVARAADSYASSLRAAQAALTASGEEALEDMLPCLAAAAAHLATALRDANVPVPEEIAEIAGWIGGLCYE